MNNQKIVLCKGLPASGKSSWTKDFVAKSNGTAKRINKDDLREMMDSSVYSKPNEAFVLKCRDLIVSNAIGDGIETIIIDDTNFEPKHFEAMERIAQNHAKFSDREVTVEYKEFLDVPLDECIRRDSLRPNPEGEKARRGQYIRYIATPHHKYEYTIKTNAEQ